jgi:hypothetical protein
LVHDVSPAPACGSTSSLPNMPAVKAPKDFPFP